MSFLLNFESGFERSLINCVDKVQHLIKSLSLGIKLGGQWILLSRKPCQLHQLDKAVIWLRFFGVDHRVHLAKGSRVVTREGLDLARDQGFGGRRSNLAQSECFWAGPW